MAFDKTIKFGEEDPDKIKDMLGIKPIYDSDADDEDEIDYDSEDEEELEEDEDETPTESYRSVVQLTPPSTPRPSFGQHTNTPPTSTTPQGGMWRPTTGSTTPYGSGSGLGFGSTGTGSTWNRPLTGWSNVGGGYGYGSSSYGNNNLQQRRLIQVPRNCKILFCELLDVILEPKYFMPGSEIYGIDPRGTYDMYPKYVIWDIIRQMRPEYVFIVTNQPGIEPGTMSAVKYQRRIESVLMELADFLKLPQERCRCFSKLGVTRDRYTKPNTGLMTEALRTIRGVNELFDRSEIYMIGSQSGYPGESDVDKKMAEAFGITYVAVKDLM